VILAIEVKYERREYVSIVEEYLPYSLSGEKSRTSPWLIDRPHVLPGRFLKKVVRLAASVAFVYKLSRVGGCKFEVTRAGLCRRAKDGLVEIPWLAVHKVFRFNSAYLVVTKRGAMPLPYRAFNETQRVEFERILSECGHA
jgi:hypothetical protein